MSLSIKRFNYSRGPWRMMLDDDEFWPGGQPYFSFQRKRDAVPFLEKLLAVGDWSNWKKFTPEQISAVGNIARETEVYRNLSAILSRPKTPFL